MSGLVQLNDLGSFPLADLLRMFSLFILFFVFLRVA